MAFSLRNVSKCQKENCNAMHKPFRTFWWHSWSVHKLFLCAHCGKEFPTYEDYVNHLSQHNDSDKASERRQSSTETTDPTEQSNKSQPNEPNRKDSSSSSDSFSSGPSTPKSSAIDKYKKIICKFPTCNWKNIKAELDMHICNEHEPKQREDKRFKCMLCHRILKFYEDIWWHYLTKHRQYACYDCCDLFSSIDAYYEHRLAHKNNEIVGKDKREREPQQSGEIFYCPYAFCNAKNIKDAYIQRHIDELHIKNNQCYKCDAKCDNLWGHYWNKHAVFICEFCQISLDTYDSYEEHRQTHTKDNTEPQEATLRHDDTSISDMNVDASTSDVNVGGQHFSESTSKTS